MTFFGRTRDLEQVRSLPASLSSLGSISKWDSTKPEALGKINKGLFLTGRPSAAVLVVGEKECSIPVTHQSLAWASAT